MTDNPPRDTTRNAPITITVSGNGGIGSPDDVIHSLRSDLAAALAEVSRLREQGEAVRAIHEKRTDGAVEYCAEDGDSWPCDTTTALEAK